MIEEDKNNKQSIKSQRVKSYFIQAAKEIIMSEGVENVSVRKVAEKAGYAYTTIYNYFTDVNELLKAVKDVMIEDVMCHMQGEMLGKVIDLEEIKRTNRAYVTYYIEHPHIFHFFYSYRLNPESTQPELPDFEKHWEITYGSFVEKGVIRMADIGVIAKIMIYSIHGLLALYFSDNGMKEENLLEDLDSIINHLLGGKITV
ncbi:TetR/AcrR family transcriptional regulator [Acetobacterium sp.]|uniref:TetR/AcrR family transcriptional regulator n=1 Tax=Acetobacterium sp. TaxID=1872094 RepID=UPI003594518E